MANGATIPQPRDENGRFTSLRDYIEDILRDDRNTHGGVHSVEHGVAKETAQRLEREIEDTEVRIEQAVKTALDAVSRETRIHKDAHKEQHAAHERIHTVEKEQVQKASDSVDKRLEGMNEVRSQLKDQASDFATREAHEALKERLITMEKRMAYYAGGAAVVGAVVGAVVAYILRVSGV